MGYAGSRTVLHDSLVAPIFLLSISNLSVGMEQDPATPSRTFTFSTYHLRYVSQFCKKKKKKVSLFISSNSSLPSLHTLTSPLHR